MMKVLTVSLSLSLSLLACGKSDKGGGGAPKVALDVAGVNALVPADLKDKLVFEEGKIEEERGKKSVTTYSLATPKGWTQDGKMFAKVKPPKEPDLGFMTSFGVGSNCDGTCEKKDWAAVSDKVEFSQFADGKIVKDEKGKTNRLMIAEKGDSTYVVYAWWTEGASRYYSCHASLEAPVKAAADAFAKACQAVNVSE